MSNKIQGYGPQSAPVAGSGRSAPVERVASDAPKVERTQPTNDSVTLTNSARTLQKLEAAVAAAPVVDEMRVAEIKDAVQKGTYEVNPERVAAKIVAASRELPGR